MEIAVKVQQGFRFPQTSLFTEAFLSKKLTGRKSMAGMVARTTPSFFSVY